MSKLKKQLMDSATVVIVLCIFFGISLCLKNVCDADTVITALFTLAVFLISLLTDGLIYGIVASLLSVLAFNYAFAFPYFKFNFSIPENMISAIIMLVITIVSSTLTTKLKLQEKMKAESAKEKMRANLLRAVSHDLRTPLTTIYGSASAIAENYSSLSEMQILQLADGIREDAQWLVGMVENLLSVTRIDNEGVKLVKTESVLEELIDSVLIRFKKRYPEQKVVVEIPEEFLCIPMDAVLIEQVLVNLLENAVKHAVGMTELKLCVYVSGDDAIFEITDDGCGIEKERLEHGFTDYLEHNKIPIDRQKSSMGIGLSVCASIIRAHEGKLVVENQKNGGCRVSFALCLKETENGK